VYYCGVKQMGERQPEGEQQLRLPTFDGGIDLGALRKQREELLLADRARLTVSG